MTKALDSCLVDEDEWNDMLNNSLQQNIKYDPFDKTNGALEFKDKMKATKALDMVD